MFNPKSGGRPSRHQQQPADEPKDALAALMDGDTPDDKSLRFPNEHSNSWRAKPSNDQTPRHSSGMEDYKSDYQFNPKPNQSMGEYHPAKQNSTLDSMKSGAANTGTYVKDKSVAGATYLKEKDWSKEKEMAGKAGQVTKTGAIYAGRGMAKGAGWLWNSSKTGIENLRSKK